MILAMLCVYMAAGASKERVLVDQEVQVIRGDFKEFHFLVAEDAADGAQFLGNFKTQGGFNDDLTFYVLTKDNFVRWYSHRKHESVLMFERKKEGIFQFKAKPGETYYFVLDNFFSTVSHKMQRPYIYLVVIGDSRHGAAR